MDHLKYWSQATNPETGLFFEHEKACLKAAGNGHDDVDALLATEYGAELTYRQLRRLEFNGPENAQKATDYLASFGVRKETHDDGNYYSRWCMCLPMDVPNDDVKKYPLIVVNGFNIDGAEFEFNFYTIAAKERFLYMSCQNTNWDNISRMIDVAAEMYPVDKERVYITGYSYAGYQSTSAFTHVPWKFAGAAPSGNDIFRPLDNFLVPYTADELASLRHFTVPFMQMVGVVEASNFVPLNDWHIRAAWGNPKAPEGLKPLWRDPRAVQVLDPTINPIRRLPDGRIQNTPPSAMPAPEKGMDRHIWMLSRLNKRLDLLKIEPRGMDKCLAYLDTPEDELHHVLGFYGDKEEIHTELGLKHYQLDLWNTDGINAFRYVAIENHPHTPPITSAKYMWDFFKQFRRDTATGKIKQEVYQP